MNVASLKGAKSKYSVNLVFHKHNLYFVDVLSFKTTLYDPRNFKILSTAQTDYEAGIFYPLSKESRIPGVPKTFFKNSAILSDGPILKVCDLSSDKTTDVLQVEDINGRIGAAACAPDGTLWYGGLYYGSDDVDFMHGMLINQTGFDLRQAVKNICVKDGLCFNLDGSRLFAMDTGREKIVVMDVNGREVTKLASCIDWKKKPLVKQSEVRGMTMDADNHLWLCCSGKSKVIRVDIEKNAIIDEVVLPQAKMINGVCFGGTENRDLFVSSSYYGLNQDKLNEEWSNSGYLFHIENTKYQGIPYKPFCLNVARDS